MQTMHSQEEELNNYFLILDTVVNRFKIQIIIQDNKQLEVKNIFGNKRILLIKTILKIKT